MTEKTDIINEYINFSDYMLAETKTNNISIDVILQIKSEWKRLFKLQLSEYGFNNISIRELFIWGNNGHNWNKLHTNVEEEKKNVIEWLGKMAGEIYYCCDKMSLDRLFRCHWLFNHTIIQFKKENVPLYWYNGIVFDGFNCFDPDKNNINQQRILCENCASKYKGDDLIFIEDNYWKNSDCSLCDGEAEYFMRFVDISLLEYFK